MKQDQRQRFDEVVAHMKCDFCPIQKECFASTQNMENDEIAPSCEDTLFHYVMTGNFLENERKEK